MKVPNGRRPGRVGGRQVNGTGLSRRGRGRSGKPVLKDKGPEAQRKWLHHCLRTLHKALKNARIFEQRKLKRRLVLLQQHGKDTIPVPERDQQGAGAETTPDANMLGVTSAEMMNRAASPALALRCAVHDGEKLQAQLEISKTLDLNDLAVQLARKSGFPDNLVEAAAHRVPPAARVSHLKEPQQRPQQPGPGRDPCEPGQCHRNGNGSGSDGGSGNGGSDPLVTVLASRLLRASCVRKAVEDARRDFEAKFGTAPVSEPGSEQQGSEDAVGDEGEDNDEDAGTWRGDEELGNSEDTEMPDADQREREEEGEDGGMALRPHKRQRGLIGAASGGMGSPAAMRIDSRPEDLQEEEEEEEVRKPPDGDGAGGYESEDSGVIEEADVDDFLADGAGGDPPVGGDGSPGSEDDDRYSNDGGESGDGSGSDGGGSISFDSEDFDLPARQKSGDAASKGPTAAKWSGGHGGDGDGGGSSGGGSSGRAATAKATSGVKLPLDAATLKATKARPSSAVAPSSRAPKADGGTAKASSPPAESKRRAGPRSSQARAAAAPEIRKGKKLKRDGGRQGDPLLDRKGKNRLGQNARRRLYEKLYGAEARHVQQHQQQERRSAKAERGQRHGMQDRTATDRGTSRSGGGGKQAITASAATSGEHQQLHPSWVAKQRQKQLLMQQAATAAPKKIKFNDDDEGNGGGDVHHGMGTASTRPKGAEKGSSPDAGNRNPGVSSCGVRRGGEGMRNGHARGRGRDEQPAQRGRGAGGGAGGRGPGGKGDGGGGGGSGGGGGDTRSLHPSWEARQRQKEQLLVAAPAGKKIVFED
ncbi:hypothetical protein Vretimale_9410 [Volvox reticuliferus]|uniref:Bud22 domain-containing protein n=1 Tax=Volvox reticuliferus TaxID=1737510 RepID=A0A8J4GDI3_9CHLO|nr:hypothetical protein Vretifemale_9877 [Volvox reticuliferus]GIM04967.1 hypothetical protein Vretimale_9410 [Volvox reticuliferus]